MTRKRTRWGPAVLAVSLTVGVGVGSAAIASDQNKGGGRGGVENRQPSHTMPTIPGMANFKQPPVPPAAQAALERRQAAAARGEHIPMPVLDHATGDLARHPDGSLIMDTELRQDPVTGKWLRNPDGSLVTGPSRPGREAPVIP